MHHRQGRLAHGASRATSAGPATDSENFPLRDGGELDNLALACHRRNLGKSPNLTGVDPATAELAPHFHPRRNPWAEHFVVRGVRIEGITPVGSATVSVLGVNDARRLELRSELQAQGRL